METPSSHNKDLEHAAAPYTRLPDHPRSAPAASPHHRPFKLLAGISLSVLLIISSLGVLIFNHHPGPNGNEKTPVSDSPSLSVSPESLLPPKRFRPVYGIGPVYPWSSDMLAWQRMGYHFQPQKNHISDPSGPMFYMGWYHLFYQYDPHSVTWQNITWGHAVSRDLINWLYLPVAMRPDQWYDCNGVWTGSAQFLPGGQLIMLYTGDTDEKVQVQNLAYPANASDPLLREWVKYENNPILVPPPGIGLTNFRDPSTAWLHPDGTWRMSIGSKRDSAGVALLYKTTNFTSYELLDVMLHATPGTGMWECVDFYPVSEDKYVLKVSFDDWRMDFYAVGTYDPTSEKFTPVDSELEIGIGYRIDYGKFYASRTFYDPHKQRRISWGYVGEEDTSDIDVRKGWQNCEIIPRTVVLDQKTGTNVLQWPVEEVESLRLNKTEFNRVEVRPGSVVPLNITSATQLDISATFEVNEEALERTIEADVGYNCSTAGAIVRGALGPFGLLVVADDSLSELTPVYFYIAKDIYGSYKTFFCTDEIRSSKAADVVKKVQGARVPVLNGEKLSMRILVDHSIVESFAQGGRMVITSRIYPTLAIYGAAQVFLFNNATEVSVRASVEIWKMDSADMHPFSLDDQI